MKTYDFSGRIAVCGIGALTPNGIIGPGNESLWENLLAGRSSIGPLSFDPAQYGIECKSSSEMPAFDFEPYAKGMIRFTPKPERRDKTVNMGLAAGILACQSAGLVIGTPYYDIGVKAGTGLGGGRSYEAGFSDFLTNGRSRSLTYTVLGVMHNNIAGFASIGFGFHGPSSGTSAACASSAQAIADACNEIRLGRNKAMLAIGVESCVTPFQIACFDQMRALSHSEGPQASKPFGLARDGFVMGEGAGALLLADMDWAIKKDLPVLAEILGYATTSGAQSSINPDAEGAAYCMEQALDDAECYWHEIGYINTHGTATPVGDTAEARALWKVFLVNKPEVTRPKPSPLINSTKALIGHTLGAAGAIETIITILSLRDQVVHPMGDYDLDPDCLLFPDAPGEADPWKRSLRIVTKRTEAQETPLSIAMSNAFGFGDHNESLVVGLPR